MPNTGRCPQRRLEAGGALIASLVTMVVCVGVAYSALDIATRGRVDTDRASAEVQARALADAGVQSAMAFLEETLDKDPWRPIDAVDRVLEGSDQTPLALSQDEPLTRNGRSYGSFSVRLQAEVDGNARNVVVTSTGYHPSREKAVARSTVQAVVRLDEGRADVFDYSYFINNWGWFYGNTIYANGNARSNGQFDAAGYSPGVNGTPRYTSVDGTDLSGYQDDNGDGITDGTDGGIYAGWDIVAASNVQGMGGKVENQHDFLEQVPMPNLSDLSIYEERAIETSASIKLGGQADELGNPTDPLEVCDGVLGDEEGEPQHLFLIGTAAAPILLDGPVVVRGDVVIKGVVSGQGTIYSGRNVYVADDLVYLDGPTTLLPGGEDEASTEEWLSDNIDKDFLGLFARENVVLGDFTNSSWRNYVGGWLDHDMNESAEDSGSDGIPNTHSGRDGVSGTEDDDLLEGDGEWTTESYTASDASLGLIPEGFSVGDAIPGSGEDIDGDGRYDERLDLGDFDLANGSFDPTSWAGNLPDGLTDFSSISSIEMTEVHAALYTNHALALLTLAWGQDFRFFGSAVSRNESLVYGTASMNIDHDRRLVGGGLYEDLLPRQVQRPRLIAWKVIEDGDVEFRVPEF